MEWSYEPALEGDLAELVWTATPTESQYTYLLTVAQMATLLDSRF